MPTWMLEELMELFSEVATVDPLSSVLFVVGNVLLLFSIAFFGVLTIGALIAGLRPR